MADGLQQLQKNAKRQIIIKENMKWNQYKPWQDKTLDMEEKLGVKKIKI